MHICVFHFRHRIIIVVAPNDSGAHDLRIPALKSYHRNIKFCRNLSHCCMKMLRERVRGVHYQFYGMTATELRHHRLGHFTADMFSVGTFYFLKRTPGRIEVSTVTFIKRLNRFAAFCSATEDKYHCLKRCLKCSSYNLDSPSRLSMASPTTSRVVRVSLLSCTILARSLRTPR